MLSFIREASAKGTRGSCEEEEKKKVALEVFSFLVTYTLCTSQSPVFPARESNFQESLSQLSSHLFSSGATS